MRCYVRPVLATIGAGWFAHVAMANATTSLARWFSLVGGSLMVTAVWGQVLYQPFEREGAQTDCAEPVLTVISATVTIAALVAFAAWLVRHLDG